MNVYKILVAIVVVSVSCGSMEGKKQGADDKKAADKMALLMDTCLSDGFDYPVGNRDGKGSYVSLTDGKTYDSWYNSTAFAAEYKLGIHTGIDLNGSGGGNTDLGQPVYSISRGWVEEAKDCGAPWGNVVLIKHIYLENGSLRTCFSVYAHLLDLQKKKGDYVAKRTLIGHIGTGGGSYPAHLHLEIRKAKMEKFELTYWPSSHDKSVAWVKENYENPEEFIDNHRSSTCPANESEIIIALKSQYRMYYYKNGQMAKQFEIALSQKPIGPKEREGDLKLPEGEYYIVEKQKGPFSGDFAEFLGPRTLRISYPNKYDAQKGFNKHLINQKEKDAIVSAYNRKEIPPSNSKLGGKIVIHGWKGDWVADGTQNLTWGCISMHNQELEAFYDVVKLKTKIIICP
ncbi:MAG: L,D-transpeptidase family protein [Bacteroidota bacterium]